MPAVVQHLSGLVDSFDVASAAEMLVALDTPMPADRVSFAGPGKTPAELTPGDRRRRDDRDGVRDRGRARGDDRRAPRASGRGWPSASTPTSRSRAPACGWAAGRSSSASTPSRSRRCWPSSRARDVEFLGFHIFAGSQNLNAEILCEAQRKTVELALRLADAAPAPVRYLNLGGGFGIPYFERTSRSTSAAIGENLAELLGGRDPARACPTRAWSIELGRYIVGECGVLRDPGRRPQGVARQDLPRRRRRPAPPARRVRQLRPGDPPQLPGRDRQPDRRRGRPRPSASSAACARRSTCSPTASSLPRADVGDLVVVFQAGAYGLTASPTAFLSHPAPVEVLV